MKELTSGADPPLLCETCKVNTSLQLCRSKPHMGQGQSAPDLQRITRSTARLRSGKECAKHRQLSVCTGRTPVERVRIFSKQDQNCLQLPEARSESPTD
eukprot:2076402-Rhodomonas_salina.3